MSTDPTLASKGTETVRSQSAGGAEGETSRLDEAIARADDLLVQSLRVEERRRKRRNLRRLIIPIGVLAMLAIAYRIALLAGIIGGPAAAVADDQKDAPQLSQEAWVLWNQRQFTDAEEKFQRAVKLDPTLVNAWNGLGWAQFNQGEYDEAEKAFKKTIELEPNHAAAENGLGQLYLAKRQYDQAEKHLLNSAKDPQATASWYGLARVYLLRAQWEKAAEWSQKLVDAGMADAQPMLDAAKAKKMPEALRKQITPIAAAPATKAKNGGAVSGASVQKGWQQLNNGQASQAIGTFNALLEKDPNDADALNGLGWASLRSGKADNAKGAFEKAMKADENAAGSYNGLAICLKNEGKTDEAVKVWRQMVEKFPGANAGTYGLATTYLERKQFDEALPLAKQLASSDPSNAEFKQLVERAKAGAGK